MRIKHDVNSRQAYVYVITMNPATGDISTADEPIGLVTGTISEMEEQARKLHKYQGNQSYYLQSININEYKKFKSIQQSMPPSCSFIEVYRNMSIGY